MYISPKILIGIFQFLDKQFKLLLKVGVDKICIHKPKGPIWTILMTRIKFSNDLMNLEQSKSY